jgi:glutathione synthase/RimK-type ligase-like ATP-grasp enzyme
MTNNKKQVLTLPSPEKSEEIQKLLGDNICIVKGSFKDTTFQFHQRLSILHKNKNIKDYDFIWLSSTFSSRDISRSISLYLKYHNTPHTDMNYGEGSSKLVDLTHFCLNTIPTPKSFFQKGDGIYHNISLLEKVCGFPLIIKDTKGLRGRNSYLANSKQELKGIINNLPKNKNFIFQQFIPNDYDWGILVAHGKVVSAEKSYRTKEEFRNNACHGAKEIFVDVSKVSKDVTDIALNACKILNLDWGRADIVIDKITNKPYLLEFNRFPGMTSGSTEVKAFGNYIKDKVNSFNS